MINNLKAPPVMSGSLQKTMEKIDKLTLDYCNYPESFVKAIRESEKVVLQLLAEKELLS